jgi:hypothetical protein
LLGEGSQIAAALFFPNGQIGGMNLHGKTREEIGRVLANKSRSELLDVIFSLSTVEQWFKPSEIAARSCINKRAVLKEIRDGNFGTYFCRAENSIAVPASGVNNWRRSFLVPVDATQNLATVRRKKASSQRMNRSSAEGQ